METEKWRDTYDPYSIRFKEFTLERVLGYPHAGNDVFHVTGAWHGEKVRAYLKVERQAGADIVNEAKTIGTLTFPFIPKLLEYSDAEPRYIVTREAVGERLSIILGSNDSMESMLYMREYGRKLGLLHGVRGEFREVAHRKFFDIPAPEYFQKHAELFAAESFLRSHTPVNKGHCFIHGDFHYANILWSGGKLSCVLDYELSGLGVREFDIAWAIFLRPGQRFLKSEAERQLFLDGYCEHEAFSYKAFLYYTVLIASRFFAMGDEEYQRDVLSIISHAISQYNRF